MHSQRIRKYKGVVVVADLLWQLQDVESVQIFALTLLRLYAPVLLPTPLTIKSYLALMMRSSSISILYEVRQSEYYIVEVVETKLFDLSELFHN